MTQPELREAVVQYADTFHAAVRSEHHVGSPLGAWMVLALAAAAADGSGAAELREVLGLGTEAATAQAGALLANAHPAVMAAAGVWHRLTTPALGEWLDRLPGQVEAGPMPDQSTLDAWASRNTDGLIDRFPGPIDSSTVLLLASALATRVSWEVPFETAPAAELGAASLWASRLTNVLRTPHGRQDRHQQFITRTQHCGDVAVHAAQARDGLLVSSVIAAPEVGQRSVLAAAHAIAIDLADEQRPGARSLFELPLGDTAMWTITEQPAMTAARNGQEQRYSSRLPAWSADSKHQLTATAGFPQAAAAVAQLVQHVGPYHEAQIAVARYTRVGFEAAAITTLAEVVGAFAARQGLVREVTIRFAHPYAVVAVAIDSDSAAGRSSWHGLPVFSAWIADPDDVTEPLA